MLLFLLFCLLIFFNSVCICNNIVVNKTDEKHEHEHEHKHEHDIHVKKINIDNIVIPIYENIQMQEKMKEGCYHLLHPCDGCWDCAVMHDPLFEDLVNYSFQKETGRDRGVIFNSKVLSYHSSGNGMSFFYNARATATRLRRDYIQIFNFTAYNDFYFDLFPRIVIYNDSGCGEEEEEFPYHHLLEHHASKEEKIENDEDRCGPSLPIKDCADSMCATSHETANSPLWKTSTLHLIKNELRHVTKIYLDKYNVSYCNYNDTDLKDIDTNEDVEFKKKHSLCIPDVTIHIRTGKNI